jgi:RNA polymerase sigma factor (sigma-70 family)
MASAPLRSAILRLLRGLPPADGTDDAALLERFVAWRDEAAFELLVYRHGPMVRGLCRRVLRHEQDAEDAFQAAFLTLARRAAKVRGGRSLAGWLYRVAFHAALKAKARTARRATADLPEDVCRGADPADESLAREVRAVLDEEVLRLPERYRLPVVLCYLQGRSNREAAAELGCPRGTVDSRLSEARRRLRGRLVRRGLAPAAGIILERVLAQAADAGELPGSVARPVVQAAVAFILNRSVTEGAVSASAAALAHEVLHTMYLTRLKWTAAIVLALGLFGSGAGVATYEAVAGGQAPAKDAAKADPPAKPPADSIVISGGPVTVNSGATVAVAKPTGPASAREVRQLLRQSAGFDKPLDEVPLKDLLDLLSDKFNVTIRIDSAAFARFRIEKPHRLYDTPVRLPVVRGMTLGEVLRDVLAQASPSQVPGESIAPVTFLVKGAQIVIVPAYMIPFPQAFSPTLEDVQPIINPDIMEEQMQGEPVTVEFQDRPLAEALRELAETTGTNIVLDSRAKDEGQTPVTATLQNVRLFTALKVLADMAQLQPVVMGNVYYVTHQQNAERLYKKEWPQPAPPPDPPGGAPVRSSAPAAPPVGPIAQ